jgi:methyltransferase
MTLPGLPLVRKGIYRYLRHPNYLGVILEILAVPLLHSAYVTAIVFSLANMLLLSVRIRTEEQALLEAVNDPSTLTTAGTPRSIPAAKRRGQIRNKNLG